jgi:hypothetical protein
VSLVLHQGNVEKVSSCDAAWHNGKLNLQHTTHNSSTKPRKIVEFAGKLRKTLPRVFLIEKLVKFL